LPLATTVTFLDCMSSGSTVAWPSTTSTRATTHSSRV
jgi:hypothetical protein